MPSLPTLPKPLQITLGVGLGIIVLGVVAFGLFNSNPFVSEVDTVQTSPDPENIEENTSTEVDVTTSPAQIPTVSSNELAEDEVDPDPELLTAEQVALPSESSQTNSETSQPGEGGVYTNEIFPSLRVPYPAGWAHTSTRVANEDFPGLDNIVVDFQSAEANLAMTLEPTGLCGCGCGNGPLPTGYEITTLPNDLVEFRDGSDVVYGEEVTCPVGFFAPSTLPLETSTEFNEMITAARAVLTEEEATQVWFDAGFVGTYSTQNGLQELRQIVGNIQR